MPSDILSEVAGVAALSEGVATAETADTGEEFAIRLSALVNWRSAAAEEEELRAVSGSARLAL